MAAQVKVTESTNKVIISAEGLVTVPDSTITSAKILDGTIVNTDINASAAIDVSKLSGVVASSGVGNLLPINIANGSESGVASDWVSAGGISGNITSTTSQAKRGTRSVTWTASNTGNIFAFAAKSAVTGSEANGYSTVTPGNLYTALVSMQSSVSETVLLRIYWYKNDGSASATPNSTVATVTLSTSSWTDIVGTAVAPTDAAWACITVFRSGGTAGTVFYADSLSLHSGAGGLWALPGVPISNLGTYTDESVGRRIFTWDTVNNRWQMTYGDTGWRDITSLITPPANLNLIYLYLRRVNNNVNVMVRSTSSGAVLGTVLSWASLGAGFTPIDTCGLIMYRYNSFADAERQLWYRDTNTLYVTTSDGNVSNIDGSWIHSTIDAWPTSLPGTAVWSIPQ